MTVPPVLRGRVVALRPYVVGFSDAELALLYDWARDAEIVALAGGAEVKVPFDRFAAMFRAQLPGRNSGREQQFAILADEGRLIGRVGLFGISLDRRAELGIVIGDRAYWGRGYGRDAVATLVDHAFDALQLRLVVLQTLAGNERAQRAFAAVGFETVRSVLRLDGSGSAQWAYEMRIAPADRSRRRDVRPPAADGADGARPPA